MATVIAILQVPLTPALSSRTPWRENVCTLSARRRAQPTFRGRRPRLGVVRVPGAETRAEALSTPLHCLRRGLGARRGAATHRRGSPQTQMPASPSPRSVAAGTTAVQRLPWQQSDSFKLQRGIKDDPVHWPRASATWHLIGPRLGGGALDAAGRSRN